LYDEAFLVNIHKLHLQCPYPQQQLSFQFPKYIDQQNNIKIPFQEKSFRFSQNGSEYNHPLHLKVTRIL